LKYRVIFPISSLSLGDMYIASQTSESNTQTDTHTHRQAERIIIFTITYCEGKCNNFKVVLERVISGFRHDTNEIFGFLSCYNHQSLPTEVPT